MSMRFTLKVKTKWLLINMDSLPILRYLGIIETNHHFNFVQVFLEFKSSNCNLFVAFFCFFFLKSSYIAEE